jgi:hypothetical protein
MKLMQCLVLARGGKKAKPPWASIARDPTALIDSSYLPASAKLDEPSKMTKDACEALLTFWRHREQGGKEPFLFSRVVGRDDGGADSLTTSEYPRRSLETRGPQQSSQASLPKGRRYKKTSTFVPGLSSSDEATSDDSASSAKAVSNKHRRHRRRPGVESSANRSKGENIGRANPFPFQRRTILTYLCRRPRPEQRQSNLNNHTF